MKTRYCGRSTHMHQYLLKVLTCIEEGSGLQNEIHQRNDPIPVSCIHRYLKQEKRLDLLKHIRFLLVSAGSHGASATVIGATITVSQIPVIQNGYRTH